MSDHELKQVIQATDRAITAEDFESLMDFYADDATLVVKPGLNATGKSQIQKAFVAIAAHFKNQMKVRQGEMKVVEGGGTALVIVETVDAEGGRCLHREAGNLCLPQDGCRQMALRHRLFLPHNAA
ncbi:MULTISPECIES: YybH family protein [Ensifer]|uniref:YybH family protein n=1 Tax=Ensifer TaxID=106591 RepID=UPI000B08AB70|nr:DUF4440 domain-containing protein [Ensifer adhaerens]